MCLSKVITTKHGGMPGPPGNLVASEIGMNGLRLTWGLPRWNGGAMVDGYVSWFIMEPPISNAIIVGHRFGDKLRTTFALPRHCVCTFIAELGVHYAVTTVRSIIVSTCEVHSH